MKKLFAILLLCFVALSAITIPMVFAQEVVDEIVDAVPTEGVTFLYVVGSWLLYMILGLVASVSSTDGSFDAGKLVKSFIYCIAVAFLAILSGIPPLAIEAEYTNIITQVLTILMNTGVFTSLIYAISKVHTIVSNVSARYKPTS